MADAFGDKQLKPGQYVWRDGVPEGAPRVIISLSDQMAYLYRGDELVAVSTISSGTAKNPTPTGIFPILAKKTMHRSKKYDNAPMPFMQRLDSYGIAMHAGNQPGPSGLARLHPPAGQVRRQALWRDPGRQHGVHRRLGCQSRRSPLQPLLRHR